MTPRKHGLTKTLAPVATLPRPKLRAAKPKTPALQVSVDHPLEGEKVLPGHYSVRIGAPGALEVEVSLDGGEWVKAREAVGYFWFDWSPKPLGQRVLEVRARRGPKAKWTKGPARRFSVVLPEGGSTAQPMP